MPLRARTVHPTTAIFLALSALSAPAAAADAPGAQSPPVAPEGPASAPGGADGVYLTVSEEVVVVGQKVGPLDSAEILTSVNILGSDEIERESAGEPLEMLRRVPAVYVETFNQGIISADVGIRGFNTQGDVAHTKLLIDGIPSNLHIGYTDLKSVFPLEIERVEVVKGTTDPRYGLNNVAGNINVVTRKGGDERVARLLAGSFGTFEPQVLAGSESGRLRQTYFAAYRGADGYRDHSRMDRVAGSGKWFYEPSEQLSVGLIVRAMYLEADAPGYLSAEDARARPTASPAHSAVDGGDQANLHASLHVDHDLSKSLSWSLKAYAQSFLRNRWVRFDAESDQQQRIEDEAQYGGSSVMTYRARDPRAYGLAVEWGLDYQAQDNVHQRFRTERRKREGDPLRDQDFTFHTFGSYVQASAKPLKQLKLTAGLRADRLAGRFADRLKDSELVINDYGTIWQPKASAVVTPAVGQSVYANYGRSFQVGTGIGAYATQAAPLAPSINDGWEVGYRSSVASWLSSRVAYWRQVASNEVRLKFDDSGDSENIGETRRHGFDVELVLRPFDFLSLWGSFSRALSEQVEPGPAFAARRGKELNHVPRFSAKGGLDYRPLDTLLLSLWCYGQGGYHLTKENDQSKAPGYVVLNADATYDLNESIALGVKVNNLLDQSYDTTIWYKDFGVPGTQHNPGDARSVYVTAASRF
jgi:iron complex outermembrane recepter protein